MILVPASMTLMGAANWWLPKWLDRRLPHIDLDGGNLPERDAVPEAEELRDPAVVD